MIRGLLISAGALTPLSRAEDVLANNLANAGTSGFRQDRIAFHRELAAGSNGAAAGAPASAAASPGAPASAAVPASSAGDLPAVPRLSSKMDPAPGALENTEDRFHLAVAGPGFFVVQGPEGELYTRDGAFRRSEDGTVMHRSGYPLLLEGGSLAVPPSADFAVSPDGTVLVDGAAQGKLRLATLSGSVSHAGSGLIRSGEPASPDTESRVLQGSLEGANVDPVLSMVQMTEVLRAFEANQRAILTQDGSLGKLVQWASGV